MSWCQDYKQVFYLSISLGLSPSCLDVSVILFLRFIDILKWQHTLQSTSRQGGVFITSICTTWPQSQQWVIYLQATTCTTSQWAKITQKSLIFQNLPFYKNDPTKRGKNGSFINVVGTLEIFQFSNFKWDIFNDFQSLWTLKGSFYLSFTSMPFHEVIGFVFFLLIGHHTRHFEEKTGPRRFHA